MKKIIILNLLLIVILLQACSTTSHKDKVLNAIDDSPVSESSIMYHDKIWYNFKNQDEDIQEKYLLYLNEIVDYISNLELEEVSEEMYKGNEVFFIKVENNKHNYLLVFTYLYPNTSYLKLSIDNKDKYYKLIDGDGSELVNIYAFSENAPFNNITHFDYREIERIYNQ